MHVIHCRAEVTKKALVALGIKDLWISLNCSVYFHEIWYGHYANKGYVLFRHSLHSSLDKEHLMGLFYLLATSFSHCSAICWWSNKLHVLPYNKL